MFFIVLLLLSHLGCVGDILCVSVTSVLAVSLEIKNIL